MSDDALSLRRHLGCGDHNLKKIYEAHPAKAMKPSTQKKTVDQVDNANDFFSDFLTELKGFSQQLIKERTYWRESRKENLPRQLDSAGSIATNSFGTGGTISYVSCRWGLISFRHCSGGMGSLFPRRSVGTKQSAVKRRILQGYLYNLVRESKT